MTLTFKTAKYAIDEHGGAFRIVRIVENFDDPTELSNGVVTRAEAEDIGEYDPGFKPCVVVTTAREALEAAWELAHEIKGDTVPSGQAYIRRGPLSFLYTVNTYGYVHEYEGSNANAEHRLLDSPEPDPEPEPWELTRFCYANGVIYKRLQNEYATYWVRGGDVDSYSREDLMKRNPRPVTIEGESE